MHVIKSATSVGDAHDGHDEWNLLVYTNKDAASAHESGVRLKNVGHECARALLIASQYVTEVTVQFGPFVMTTENEVLGPVMDF